MKILIVDDSSTMRAIIKRGLATAHEAEFVEAVNGKEALELLAGAAADAELILLDINMPELNGLDTLVAIKAQECFAATPVVMVTTEADKATVVKAISSGAVGYVVKPFDPETLVSKVGKALAGG
ncbi:MAG: response regulator [Planctomycetota bacterium]|jgi:two-component system chemotaxis response regulator CheY